MNMDHPDSSNYFNGLWAEDRLSYINTITLSNGVRFPDPYSLSGQWVKDPTKWPSMGITGRTSLYNVTLWKNSTSIWKKNWGRTNLLTRTILYFAVMSRTLNTETCQIIFVYYGLNVLPSQWQGYKTQLDVGYYKQIKQLYTDGELHLHGCTPIILCGPTA